MKTHYSYRVVWSEEDQEHVATCVEFPSLSHLAPTAAEALAGIEALVSDVVADLQASGEPIPKPATARKFTGRFLTRLPPLLHERLFLTALEKKVSINSLVEVSIWQLLASDPRDRLVTLPVSPRSKGKRPRQQELEKESA